MNLVLSLLACGGPQVVASPAPTRPSAGVQSVSAPLPPDAVVQTLLAQHVLDHPAVVGFLHLEIPENTPLRVHAVSDLADGVPGLTAGGQAVLPTSRENARLRLTTLETDGPRARIRLTIPSEGVVGWVDLELVSSVWSVVGAEIAER